MSNSDTMRKLMKLVESTMNEAPLADYTTVGSFVKPQKPQVPVNGKQTTNADQQGQETEEEPKGNTDTQVAWQFRDKARLTNPAFIKKLSDAFAKTPFNFNLVVVGDTNEGERKRYSGQTIDNMASFESLVSKEDVTKVKAQAAGAITLVIATNDTVSGRAMSPWMFAHKIAHGMTDLKWDEQAKFGEMFFGSAAKILKACYSMESDDYDTISDFTDEWDEYLENVDGSDGPDWLAYDMFTMKSASEYDPYQGWTEKYNELIAQYIITGSVKFATWDSELEYENSTFTLIPGMEEKLQSAFTKFEELTNKFMQNLLNGFVGKIVFSDN